MPSAPSNGKVTAEYGPRINPVTGNREIHHGRDQNASAGTLLTFPEDGVLIHWGPKPGWPAHGNVAIIAGDSGYEHWLSHTSAALCSVGVRRREHESAAVMGMSGQTTGLHVHWETRLNGKRLNPAEWLTQFASSGSKPFTLENEDEMKLLEIMTCPAWEAVNEIVVTNGSTCQTYPAGWLDMLQNRAKLELTRFENNSDMLTMVSMIYELSGLEASEAARRTKLLIDSSKAVI